MTKMYDKCDKFSFLIANFPFIYNNIASAPANGVHITTHTYARACRNCADFVYFTRLLTVRVLELDHVSSRKK